MPAGHSLENQYLPSLRNILILRAIGTELSRHASIMPRSRKVIFLAMYGVLDLKLYISFYEISLYVVKSSIFFFYTIVNLVRFSILFV